MAMIWAVAATPVMLVLAAFGTGLLVGTYVSFRERRREDALQRQLQRTLRELEVRDEAGRLTNARAIELMKPALEKRLRHTKGSATSVMVAPVVFEQIDEVDVPDRLEAFKFAEGEPEDRVTACGILWDSRKVGRSNGQWAVRLEHVIDRPQLEALGAHIRHWAAGTNWHLAALTSHTSRANGVVLLRLSPSDDAGQAQTAASLYAALQRPSISPRRPGTFTNRVREGRQSPLRAVLRDENPPRSAADEQVPPNLVRSSAYGKGDSLTHVSAQVGLGPVLAGAGRFAEVLVTRGQVESSAAGCDATSRVGAPNGVLRIFTGPPSW